MKKLLLFVCVLTVSNTAFAQLKMLKPLNERLIKKVVNTSATIPIVTPLNSASAPDAIWSDDFSTPSNWVIAHDPSACSLDWQIGVNSCQGSYPILDILSTTASNGYAMIDSDFYGGATGGDEMEDCWLTMANPVDLNGYPNVNVEFETNYKSYNNEQTYIVVGIGDGSGNVTWPDLNATTDISTMNNVFKPFLTGPDDVAVTSTNPQLMSINISSALVGLTSTELADLYIRFHWTGTWGYAWFVDDFAILETPDNAIVASNEVTGGFWIDYENYSGAGLNDIYGLDYSQMPLSQLSNHPFSFEALVKNTGLSVQHTVLKYDVTGASSASGVSSTIVLNPQEDSSFAAVPTFGDGNTVIGSYSVDIWAEADSAGTGAIITTSPPVTKAFEITEYIYGKDLGEENQTGAYYLGGPVDQNHITTRYEMYANESLTGLRAFIGGNSAIGAKVKAVLYELDSTASNGLFPLAESDDYFITVEDLGVWVDIPFVSPISLFAGYAYEFGIAGYQHPVDTSFIGVSGSMMYAGEHSSFDEFGLSSQSEGEPTWYYISSAPMVRMSFDSNPVPPQTFDCIGTNCVDPGNGTGMYSSFSSCQSVCNPTGLEEVKLNISIYPNPTDGVFTIELEGNLRCDITVYNVLGQTVYATSANDMQTIIDLSEFDKGIYTVELKDEKVIYTEKVIVE